MINRSKIESYDEWYIDNVLKTTISRYDAENLCGGYYNALERIKDGNWSLSCPRTKLSDNDLSFVLTSEDAIGLLYKRRCYTSVTLREVMALLSEDNDIYEKCEEIIEGRSTGSCVSCWSISYYLGLIYFIEGGIFWRV